MPRARIPMPGRVLLAFGILAILAVLALAGAFVNLAVFGWPAFLPLLFLVPLARGHPLARQWVRYVALLCALSAFVLGLRFLLSPERDVGLWLALTAGAALVLFWSVEGIEAKRFFDVYCTYCRTDRVRARDLFYNRIACLRCGQEWRPHGRRVDAAVFD